MSICDNVKDGGKKMDKIAIGIIAIAAIHTAASIGVKPLQFL